MAYNFPDKKELTRQIEKGYIKPDRDFDVDEFMDFIYFELWREGKLSQERRQPFFEHVGTLLRGGWRYMKKKLSILITGGFVLSQPLVEFTNDLAKFT